MLMMPLTGRREPSSESSPTKNRPAVSLGFKCPAINKMLIAMGRSRLVVFLVRSAGARLTVILRAGKSKPELLSALLTRSLASLTVRVAMPTILKAGRLRAESLSMVTIWAS